MERLNFSIASQSPWVKWENRSDLPHIAYPGVYLIAKIDDTNHVPKINELPKEVIYIGMTAGKTKPSPLTKRLNELNLAITEFTGHHSGGCQIVRKFADIEYAHRILRWDPPKWLFVSVIAINEELPIAALRHAILDLEADLIQHYSTLYGEKPICNTL